MALPLATFAASVATGLAKGAAGALSGADPKTAKARQTANEFESMFLEQTLDRLFADSGEGGPLGDNGAGGAVYRSMLTKEYASRIVKSGGVGISSQVFGELMGMQEAK